MRNLYFIGALFAILLASPAAAQPNTISCGQLDVTEVSAEELVKIRETCIANDPPDSAEAVQDIKNWSEMMRVYAESAKREAATLGITPVAYMNSSAGQIALSALWLKVYRNLVIASFIMIMTWLAALYGSRLLIRRAEYGQLGPFEAGWQTLMMGGLAFAANLLTYLALLS